MQHALVRDVTRIVLACAFAATAATTDGAPSWYRVRSPHFVVSGQVGGRQVRQVALRLEQFHDAVHRILPAAAVRTLLPPFVVVFADDKAFRPFKPLYDGQPAPLAGYVVSDRFAPCIALSFDRGDESYRTVFHEYAHLMVEATAPAIPLWFSEGSADYYSTLVLSHDGRRVTVGQPVPSHVAILRRHFMPLADLLATTRDAKIWDGNEGRVFYAESWALVHYLLSDPTRAGQVKAFLQKLAAGVPPAEALAAFGAVPRLEPALREHIGRMAIYRGEDVRLAESIAVERLAARAMSEAEVEATLGRVTFHLRRDDEALAHLETAVRLDPRCAEALATLGLLKMRQERPAESLAPLERANELDPANALVAYDYALMTLQAHDATGAGPLDAAFAALSRLVDPEQAHPEALAVLGTIAGRLGRLDEAEPLLRRANALAPNRLPTRLELADVCARLGRFDEARSLLASLESEAGFRDVSKTRLRWLSKAEERARIRAELAAARPGGTPPGDAGKESRRERTGSFPPAPEFRALHPGERRDAGWLEAIECPPVGGVRAEARTAAGALRLVASGLDKVDILTYRREEAGDGTVSCGDRFSDAAALITWRPGGITPLAGADVQGRIVAIEILPVNYLPHH